jgi:hypothetical protein
MHSWRTLIEPDSERGDLAERYDFNQPWDSAANFAFARTSSHRECYFCSEDLRSDNQRFANYVMIVESSAATSASEPASLKQMTDGPAKTILIAEIADSDIFWTEPRDLSVDEMSLQVNDRSRPSISSHHLRNGALVLFADGTVKFLDASTPPDKLRAMLTRAAND